MIRTSKLLLVLVMTLSAACGWASGDVIGDFDALKYAETSLTNVNRRFSVTGRIVGYYQRTVSRSWIITLHDGKSSLTFHKVDATAHPSVSPLRPVLGEKVRLTGRLFEWKGGVRFGYETAEVLSREIPPDLILTCSNVCELVSRGDGNRLLRFSGVIRELFRDESDPRYFQVVMDCGGQMLHAIVAHHAADAVDVSAYIGAHATATGTRINMNRSLRRQIGFALFVSGIENLHIDTPPVSAGELKDAISVTAEGTRSSGLRTAYGDVLCVWQGNQALLRVGTGSVVRVGFLASDLPHIGERIAVRGIVETDLYHLNLASAAWRPQGTSGPLPDARDIHSARALFTNDDGFPRVKIREHGNTLRLTGVVRHLPQSPTDTRFQIESDGFLIPIDIGTDRGVLDALALGCTVQVTGTCVLDIDNYGIGTSIPRAKGLFLVLRSPDDLIVLAMPSWWTPRRLLTVISILVLLLFSIVLWNISLRRLAERRGRALAQEEVRQLSSELKVCERTHLAVELHDSLSQTLSGISLQIDAVRRFAETDRPRMLRHLGFAAQALRSCRAELRNCLTDLRSEALEVADMNDAIRMTLSPYSGEAAIVIRFFIPRKALSDNTAHAILSIIRELVANAIRHGHATKIRIAGSLEAHLLKFSVRDNGTGFDLETAPGIAEGHFGLQGIRERIEHLEGTLAIGREDSGGTCVSAEIPIHHDLSDEVYGYE